MPTRPSKSKWTKYPVAADWWMLASGLMNLLSRLWPLAYQKLTLRAIKVGKNAGDPELTQDFDWHNVEGKRCQFIGRSLGERLTQFLIITCILIRQHLFIIILCLSFLLVRFLYVVFNFPIFLVYILHFICVFQHF